MTSSRAEAWAEEAWREGDVVVFRGLNSANVNTKTTMSSQSKMTLLVMANAVVVTAKMRRATFLRFRIARPMSINSIRIIAAPKGKRELV
jgi:hypothetical protein